jgi:hypothetical protein
MSLKRALLYVLMSFALAGLGAYLTRAAEAGARPANGWRYSDRAYKNDARTPLPIGNSQAILRRLLLEVGHSGAHNMQTVIALDGPRQDQGKLLFWIARGDTLWHASVPPGQCLDGECSFLGVVDGEAPDSTTIVFVDWSTLTLANDGKGKRK